MRNVPIIDAHVHLWNPQTFPMPWLAEVPAINYPFGLPEYNEHTRELPISGMVYVEVDVAPQFALLEAEHIVELAAQDSRLLGIVATAPVQYGEQVRIYLDALRKLGPLIKGVRRNVQGADGEIVAVHAVRNVLQRRDCRPSEGAQAGGGIALEEAMQLRLLRDVDAMEGRNGNGTEAGSRHGRSAPRRVPGRFRERHHAVCGEALSGDRGPAAPRSNSDRTTAGGHAPHTRRGGGATNPPRSHTAGSNPAAGHTPPPSGLNPRACNRSKKPQGAAGLMPAVGPHYQAVTVVANDVGLS